MLETTARYNIRQIGREVPSVYKPSIFMAIEAESGPLTALVSSSSEFRRLFGYNKLRTSYIMADMLLQLGYSVFVTRVSLCNNRISARLHTDTSLITHPEYVENTTGGVRDIHVSKGMYVTTELVIPRDADGDAKVTDRDFILFNTNNLFWTGVLFNTTIKDSAVSRDFFYKAIIGNTSKIIAENKESNTPKLDWIKYQIQDYAGYSINNEVITDDKVYLSISTSKPGRLVQTSFKESYNDQLNEYTIQSNLAISSRVLDIYSKYDSGVENIIVNIEQDFDGNYFMYVKRMDGDTVVAMESHYFNLDYKSSLYVENISNASNLIEIKYYGDKNTIYDDYADTWSVVFKEDVDIPKVIEFTDADIPLKRRVEAKDATAKDYVTAINNLQIGDDTFDIIVDSGVNDVRYHEALLSKLHKSYAVKIFKYTNDDSQIPEKDRNFIAFFNGDINNPIDEITMPSWMFYLMIKVNGHGEWQFRWDDFGNQYLYIEDKANNNPANMIVNYLEFESPYIKLINPLMYMGYNTELPVGPCTSMMLIVNYLRGMITDEESANNARVIARDVNKDMGVIANEATVSIDKVETSGDTIKVYFYTTIIVNKRKKFSIAFDILVYK